MLHRMLRARFLFALGLVACDTNPHYPTCPTENVCVSAPTDVEAGAPAPYAACEANPQTDNQHVMRFNEVSTGKARTSDRAACCYEKITLCPGGRPLRDDTGHALLADVVSRDDWHADVVLAASARASELPSEVRVELAAAWTRDARAEHASIAAFATLVLDLLALGAPAALVTEAQRAAGDEIEHARIAFALASAYAGTKLGPSAWPLAGASSARSTSLVTLVRDAVLEGCVGESTAAWSLHARARNTEGAHIRALCTQMAEDEERHALLAFRIVAWAVGAGGPEVEAAVWSALAEAGRPRPDESVEETAGRMLTVATITRDCLTAQLAATG